MTVCNRVRGIRWLAAILASGRSWTGPCFVTLILLGGPVPALAQSPAPQARAVPGPIKSEAGPAPVTPATAAPTPERSPPPPVATPAPPAATPAPPGPERTASPNPMPSTAGPVPKEVFDEIVKFVGKRDYQGALAFLDKTMADRGKSTALLILRGRVNIDAKQLDQSLADMTRAIEFDRNSGDGYLWRARVRAFELPLTRDNVAAAEADFAEAERRAPQNAQVYYYHGRLFAATDQPDKAIGQYDLALVRDPKYADAHRSRTITHYSRGNHDAALKSANEAIASVPSEGNPYAIRGLIMLARKDSQAARTDIAKAQSLRQGFELYTALAATALSAAAVIDRNGSITQGAR